jgi:hypothetical protein
MKNRNDKRKDALIEEYKELVGKFFVAILSFICKDINTIYKEDKFLKNFYCLIFNKSGAVDEFLAKNKNFSQQNFIDFINSRGGDPGLKWKRVLLANMRTAIRSISSVPPETYGDEFSVKVEAECITVFQTSPRIPILLDNVIKVLNARNAECEQLKEYRNKSEKINRKIDDSNDIKKFSNVLFRSKLIQYNKMDEEYLEKILEDWHKVTHC